MQVFDLDLWQEIVDTLKRHKLRTALTAFGVFWGIFMLVTLMGAGKGLKNGAVSNWGNQLNTITFWKGRATTIPYMGLDTGRDIMLKHSDVEFLVKKIPEIKYVAPYIGADNIYVSYKGRADSYSISGYPPIISKIQGFELLQGRFLNALDEKEKRKVGIIGRKVRDTLFPNGEDPIGKAITYRGMQLTVVGVFQPSAKNEWQQRDSSKIFAPYATLKQALNIADRIYSLTVVPVEGVHASVLEKKIKKALLEKNRVHPDDWNTIGSYNSQKDLDQVNALFGGIQAFSWVVAIGTIIAGAVGVGNIMLIAVKERTKEIGLRKAIGATPMSIVSMIVQESLLITFISGYFGLFLGVILVETIANVMMAQGSNSTTFANPEIDFVTALTALGVLLLAGMFAAWLPAQKAAKIDPAIALQDQ
ncbi:ABC transporter permease [Teredinibacter sp. KSP-S5-2]|uniref:ABC transporter permease n=1 Tax=Teredinibacter sp. KSP-S5-2 TaxID=3034506 RepID=UPI002934E630|nr:ABC transporter permease [Teredinibacter sp. KSP-S5-2]WNO09784.1 ABC transporter permease [Teredinibacter sp. KSP-S5-2]